MQGVILNPLTPEWLQTALLSVLLVVVVRKTYAKGFKQLQEEKKSSGRQHQQCALDSSQTNKRLKTLTRLSPNGSSS